MTTKLPSIPLAVVAWVVLFLNVASLRAADSYTGLKSAVVEATFEAAGMGTQITGTKKTWYADYGRKQATRKKEKTVTKMFGMSQTQEKETLSIIDGDSIYEIDLTEKTGTRMSLKMAKDFASGYTEEMRRQGKRLEDCLDEWLKANKGRRLANKVLLGRTCSGIEVFGVQQWLYEQIPLQVEGQVMGIATKEVATSLQENVAVGADVFKVPAGIRIEEMPDMAGMMQGREMGKATAGGGTEELAGLAGLIEAAQKQAAAEEGRSSSREGTGADGGEVPAGVNLVTFKSMIAKVTVKDLGRPVIETEEGQHSATFMKSMFDQVSVVAAGYSDRATALARRAFDEDETVKQARMTPFTRKGVEALHIELVDAEGTVQGRQVLLFDAKRKTTFVVSSQPARAKAELDGILEQMGL